MDTSACASSLANSSVKELVRSSGDDETSLPSIYITRSPAMAATEMINNEEIPSIDFSLLTSKIPGEREQAIEKLGQACEKWGCFTIVNHGVSEDLQSMVMEAYTAFFDQTLEEKQKSRSKLFVDSVVYGTSYNPAVKDVRYWRDYLRTMAHPTFHSPTQPPNFRLVTEEFAMHTREIAKELVIAICESLGLEANDAEASLSLESCSQFLIGNLYPPCPQPELAQGLPPHSDAALIALLMQNSYFPGLQVMPNGGGWVPVLPIPNTLFVILADLLEIFSNGKYKSVLHRAMVDKKSTRLSVVSAMGTPIDTVVVAPAPKLFEGGTKPAAFRGITYRDYIKYSQTNQLNKVPLEAVRL